MSTGTEEIEQGFTPTAQLVADMKRKPDQTLSIIQAYLPADQVERSFSLENQGGEVKKVSITLGLRGRAVLKVEETDPEKIQALLKANGDTGGQFLENIRLRAQKDMATGELKTFLTVKGPKTDGAGTEFEFEAAQKSAALQLMQGYGNQKLVGKTRYVKGSVIVDGKPRIFELDEFTGKNTGKHKLEIEHKSKADMIPETEWQQFATADVTNDKGWSNYSLAQPDPMLLADILRLNTAAVMAARPATAPKQLG